MGYKSNMIYGFYLIMVIMQPNGDIETETLDYFSTPHECIMEGNIEEQNAPFGVGFVCIEDYIE